MHNREDLISVIVPVYNVEKYLDRCVQSLLSQTYKQLEIILIDDGSPDNCPQLCDEYAMNHNNIIVLHLKNSGLSGARNAGIEKAKGKYIAFVDSDDYVDSELFSVLKKGIDVDADILLSMCSFRRLSQSDRMPKLNRTKDVKVINDFEAMDMLISNQDKTTAWGKLYAKELFKELRFPVGRHYEDMFVMPTLFRTAKKVSVSSQELYFYCQDGESITRSTFHYKMLEMIDAISFWNEQVVLYYPELLEKAKGHYFTAIITSCQFLAKKTDDFGILKYRHFKNEITEGYRQILRSKYINLNSKIKAILLQYGLFKFTFQIIELLNIRKYN